MFNFHAPFLFLVSLSMALASGSWNMNPNDGQICSSSKPECYNLLASCVEKSRFEFVQMGRCQVEYKECIDMHGPDYGFTLENVLSTSVSSPNPQMRRLGSGNQEEKAICCAGCTGVYAAAAAACSVTTIFYAACLMVATNALNVCLQGCIAAYS